MNHFSLEQEGKGKKKTKQASTLYKMSTMDHRRCNVI